MSESTADVGIDVGGTFTDFVRRDGEVVKLPSDANKPGAVFEEGISGLYSERSHGTGALRIAHGTTVATNALLTGELAETGILITAGFRDLLALGRQNRPLLYDLDPRPSWSPPPRELIGEVTERIDRNGEVLVALEDDEIRRLGKRLVRRGARAFAICFLHSYRNPSHERRAAAVLRELGHPVTASAELVSEFREFERFSTALANASLMPLLDHYIEDLRRRLPGFARAAGARGRPRLSIMQSDGGRLGMRQAAKEPARLVLSGPAGGLVGAWASAANRKRRRMVTFDMGGTSTDVALLDGGEPVVSRSEIAGRPLVLPVLDIHTVGAGGGSIAFRDLGGGLRVGPESAGADPGPACYGRNGPCTVTDANVYLGRIPPGRFLGGEFELSEDRSRDAVEGLARDLALDPEACALGVLQVAEVTMERALRRISLERGHDPREFSLVAFGGAGALHAAALAGALEMPEVVIPPNPGLLSAYGMLHARVKKERSRTVLGLTLAELEASPDRHFRALESSGMAEMKKEGLASDQVVVQRFIDGRLVGQSYELSVPFGRPGSNVRRFHDRHAQRHGFTMKNREFELVALRVRLLGPAPRRQRNTIRQRAGAPKPLERIEAGFARGRLATPVYDRVDLRPGRRLRGPLIVVEYSSTTVVPPQWDLEAHGALVIRRRP